MNLQTYARVVADQYLSNDELAIIRKSATEMMKNIHTEPAGAVLLKLLNHINLVSVDKADMVDVIDLQEKLTDRETRLKAMEIAYNKMVDERDMYKNKLESLGVTV